MEVSFKNSFKIHQNSQKSSLKTTTGLTLIELLVTLVVISVVLSYGVPEAQSLVKLNESAVTINKFVSDFAYSRTESIKRMRDVVICKSSDGQTCNNNADWQNGWIIFVDNLRNKQRDADEPLLKVQQPLGNHLNITFHSFNKKKMIVYEPSGASDYSNGTFRFCTNNERYHKDLVLSRTGHTRLKVNPGKIFDSNKPC